MIKKDLEFEDFDGNKVTRTCWFHLSKKKLLELDAATEGGLQNKLERIGSSASGAEIMQTFTELVGHAYGERDSADSTRFRQSPELTAKFLDSLEFEALLTMLLTNPKEAIAFINGLMPKELMELAAQAEAARQVTPHPDGSVEIAGEKYDRDEFVRASGLQRPYDSTGAPLPWALRDPTHKELSSMTQPQMAEVYARKASSWIPSQV